MGSCESSEQALSVQYLGSSGFLIKRGDDAILTGPYFSHARLSKVVAGAPLEVDTELIESLMPELDGVQSVLVGHSHYDHLMDTAYVLETMLPEATLYGNRTAGHLVAPLVSDVHERFIALNRLAGDRLTPGVWLPEERDTFRFMAFRSQHAPHIGDKRFFDGHLTEDRATPPVRARDWIKGKDTYAFVIDAMTGDSPVARIHYQDSASARPFGFVPTSILAKKAVDIAIVCVASFDNVQDYPAEILRALKPKYVILSHWEDFFRDRRKKPALLPGTDLRKLIREIETESPESSWMILEPGVTVTFDLCPRR